MTAMLLSDVKPMVPRNMDHDDFVKGFFKPSNDYASKTQTYDKWVAANSVPNGCVYHRNYMEYLETAWANHLGIEITPDIVWFALLAELALVVAKEPERFRALFSDSAEKKEISVHQEGSAEILPLFSILEQLKALVPTDIDLFLPDFSTSSARSVFARAAIFADMCSPYYNYSMFCCNFASIDVKGETDDWVELEIRWWKLRQLFDKIDKKIDADYGVWFRRVTKTLDGIIANLASPDYWRDIFKLERCGSGGQTEIYGWWTDLYREAPKSVRFSHNFSTHLATVNYRNLSTKKNFVMNSGLLYSKLEDGVLRPDWGFVVGEVLDKPIVVPYDPYKR